MTDDQLQSLFAGMESHLDKRTEQTEQHILREVNARIEALETKLLGEFWKWARTAEASDAHVRRDQLSYPRTVAGP